MTETKPEKKRINRGSQGHRMGRPPKPKIPRAKKIPRSVRQALGMWDAGRPPYGYVSSKQTRQLIICPPEAMVVRLIFEMFDGGAGTRRIAEALSTSGYTTRHGKAVWNCGSIHRIIRHRALYEGTEIHGIAWPGGSRIPPILETRTGAGRQPGDLRTYYPGSLLRRAPEPPDGGKP